MDKASEIATRLVDKIPNFGMGVGMCDVAHGWGVKLLLLVAIVETLMSLGTWKTFGWMLVIQLVLSVAGLFLNRHCKDMWVWVVALLSVLVYPVMNNAWVASHLHL